MQQYNSFDRLIIEFNSGAIPPPFCHRYTIAINREDAGKALASLELEYFDREELTEEEIYDEGFTPNDDFKWEGLIPSVWINELSTKLSKTNWKKKPTANADGSEFLIKWKNKNQSELLQPADTASWQILVQEIIQAVFEVSKKEAPLSIGFADQSAGTSASILEIVLSFSNRQVSVICENSPKNEMSWEAGHKLLKHIFSIDFFPENGIDNISGKKGIFIAPGDGLWYELDPMQHPDQKTQDKISKLISNFKQLQ